METTDNLLHEAKTKGMCLENFNALRHCTDRHQQIYLYKKTIDWALENSYPNIATIRRDFSDCEDDGVFVDKQFHGETFNDQQTYVFHHCSGTINVEMNLQQAIIPMLYFANDCHINVTCNQSNVRPINVPLYIFGDSTITTEDVDGAKFTTYNFDLI
jgi:hypothetical protein